MTRSKYCLTHRPLRPGRPDHRRRSRPRGLDPRQRVGAVLDRQTDDAEKHLRGVVAAVHVGLTIEVLRYQVQALFPLPDGARDPVGEDIGPLQCLLDVVVPGDHPVAVGRRVPQERRLLAWLVQAGVGLERRTIGGSRRG